MISAISTATQTQPVAQSTKPVHHKPTQAKPQSATVTDSVELSQAAQAMLAAVQEAGGAPAKPHTK